MQQKAVLNTSAGENVESRVDEASFGRAGKQLHYMSVEGKVWPGK